MVKVTDAGITAIYRQAFDHLARQPSVEAEPYNIDDDEYFSENVGFPVPLTTPDRYLPKLKCHQNDPAQLLLRLHDAVKRRASDRVCLRWWSKFIRARDGERCVACGCCTGDLAAHHICRKTVLAEARFMTGNGVTLCSRCHAGVHEGFNGCPDLGQPMDAEGGEKIELLADIFMQLANASAGGTWTTTF
ncbi:MAG TPA: hypothetical protein VGL56_19960 [Fimbriimonadaceae bacterium]|jgi:hypothetical protein